MCFTNAKQQESQLKSLRVWIRFIVETIKAALKVEAPISVNVNGKQVLRVSKLPLKSSVP